MIEDFHVVKRFFEILKFDVIDNADKGQKPSFKILNVNGYEVEVFQHPMPDPVCIFFIRDLGITIPFNSLVIAVYSYIPDSTKSYALHLFINEDEFATCINITNHINSTIIDLPIEYLKSNLTKDQLMIMPLGMDIVHD